VPPFNAMQNVKDDIDFLKGATIERIWFADWDDGFEVVPEGVVRIRLRFAENVRVNDKTHGEYEIWQDPEGNGPGFVSFVQEG